MPEERTQMHDAGLLGTAVPGEVVNKSTPVNGEVFTVPYPFVRDVFMASAEAESEGGSGESWEEPTWKPGVRFEITGYGAGDGIEETFADGMGQMVLTVVSVHRPGSYPTRVFYTRQWIDPDGKAFGKRKLRITTTSVFKAMSRGYRHKFEMAPQVQEAS